MDAETLAVLRAPGSLRPLQQAGAELVSEGGDRFAIRDGIPDLRGRQQGWRRWELFYDRTAFGYDATLRFGSWLGLGHEEQVRRELLPKAAKAGDRVLDVGCGTAESRPFFPAGVRYLGLDVSRGMLQRAMRKCAALSMAAMLVQAEASQLPVASAAIDAAVAMGVFQHLRQPEVAMRDLLRVVKPGGAIYLIDESRALAKISKSCTGQPRSRQDFCTQLERQYQTNVSEQGEIGEYFFISFKPNRAL
jgi:ubiquinone/menaquinone biosynthesis C-methylase UbiE